MPLVSRFVALVPPPEVRAAIRAVLPSAPQVRWTAPAQWHVTLRFLGEADPPDLAAIAHATAPFALAVRGAGRFDDRVLWAALAGETDRLHALAAALGATDYRPHLTLGFGSGLAPLVTALRELRTPPWTVREIVLFRSERGVYSPLGSWAFSGP
ncbi:RNA 2',3'-cyclic phosphodiesterase [Pseudonocardia sp. WMMC193]|uniref:RNA 2',3'-cyclic phosphodiesterase n=1 Tax=Pseudonocardia sp. WMMC193 TaxID=2911965 RepID=UPI001EFFB6E3|nr:RNA 2',3'-cyclic phosphodiesterase [Pseudonocardia sp. WMMC193]MCF7552430.1 RNA 2',3'-cyclic phosphodiesterase [Pseudonocardia sp. WMMC193]